MTKPVKLIALLKAKPSAYSYGSSGVGNTAHVFGELFKARTGVDIVHVPYRGIADATKDLLAGRIQAMTASIPATAAFANDHRVKVLAVTSASRIDLLPDVPSWKDAGVDATVVNYWGIVAPAGTPRDIVTRVNTEVQRVLEQPDVRSRLAREGAELIPGSPEQFALLIERDLKAWKKLIVDAKLKLD
jgi:tripartite-type tricarboxylate transporter receptor subunit TctC